MWLIRHQIWWVTEISDVFLWYLRWQFQCFTNFGDILCEFFGEVFSESQYLVMYSVVYLWLTFRNIWWNKNHKYLLSSTDRLQSSKYKYKYSFQYEYTFDIKILFYITVYPILITNRHIRSINLSISKLKCFQWDRSFNCWRAWL